MLLHKFQNFFEEGIPVFRGDEKTTGIGMAADGIQKRRIPILYRGDYRGIAIQQVGNGAAESLRFR